MANILILAYKFPPMGTIGTRRWTKFAKYLSSNHNISVLARSYKYNDTINWTHDLEDLDINIQYFNTLYPMLCLKNEKKLYEKIICKLFTLYKKKFSNSIDIADNKFINFYEQAIDIIKNKNITNIIVTGPPHSFLYYASILKSEFPTINFIIDYRDPWNYFPAYKLPSFNDIHKKEKSIRMEREVISMANHIICTTKDMSINLKNMYPGLNLNISTIYNAYDKDDYKNIDSYNKKNNSSIKIIYAGSLEKGRIEAIKLIAESLNILEKNNHMINIQFIFYSNINVNKFFKFKYYETLNKYFTFYGYLKQEEIFQKIAQCDYALSINSIENSSVISTKVFDYMALKKQIWHISNGGELFELLTNHSQYVSSYNLNEISNILINILKNNGKNNVVQEYTEFNILNQTKKLEKLLI